MKKSNPTVVEEAKFMRMRYPNYDTMQYAEIREWAEVSCKNQFFIASDYVSFKIKEDVLAYMMRWL